MVGYINDQEEDEEVTLEAVIEALKKGESEARKLVPRAQNELLLDAATKGEYNVVEFLLKEKLAVINCQHEDWGQTPLSLAAEKGNLDVVKLLLKYDAGLTILDKWNETALHWAADNGHAEVVKELLGAVSKLPVGHDKTSKSPKAPSVTTTVGTTIHVQDASTIPATTQPDKNDVGKESSSHQPDPNSGEAVATTESSAPKDGGGSAAERAPSAKNPLVDRRDKDDRTPLSYACGGGHLEVVKILLQAGAEPNLRDSDHRTPLAWAAETDSENGPEVVEFLLQKSKAQLDEGDVDGHPPLFWACSYGRLDVVKSLIGAGAHSASNSLSWAAGAGRSDVVDYLLKEKGIVPDQSDDQGRTPLSHACGMGRIDMVRFFLGKNAAVESQDRSGRTPLSWAAGEGHEDVVDLLLDENQKTRANPNATDKRGRTPLAWAALNEEYRAVRTLLKRDDVRYDDEDEEKDPLSLAASKDGWRCEVIMTDILERAMNERDDWTSWASQYLLKAASKGWRSLAEHLLDKDEIPADKRIPVDADSPKCTPLSLAVDGGFDRVVQVLLDKGATVEESMFDAAYASRAPRKYDMLHLLSQHSKDGALALDPDDDQLKPTIDEKYLATVVEFFPMDSNPPQRKDCTVRDLFRDLGNGNGGLRWLHLPANNMRWVEVLIAKYYSMQDQEGLTYIALKPERWIRRQHQHRIDSYHTRSMKPLCEIIPATFTESNKADGPKSNSTRRDKPLVLFMPFLHWELTEVLDKRKEFVEKYKAEEEKEKGKEEAKEEKGLNEKIEVEEIKSEENSVSLQISTNDSAQKPSNNDPFCELLQAYVDNQHPLHIRRTLDQYDHHERKVKGKNSKSKVNDKSNTDHDLVTTMVDQLWLWVLVGKDGQADTVISSFARRAPFPDSETSKSSSQQDSITLTQSKTSQSKQEDPDRYHLTDIVETICLQLLNDPTTIRTAYDLAGFIASKCSRVYLDTGNDPQVREELQFWEKYRNKIEDIRSIERERFDAFVAFTAKELPKKLLSNEEFLRNVAESLDIREEMENLFEDQEKVLKAMESKVQNINKKSKQQAAGESSTTKKAKQQVTGEDSAGKNKGGGEKKNQAQDKKPDQEKKSEPGKKDKPGDEKDDAKLTEEERRQQRKEESSRIEKGDGIESTIWSSDGHQTLCMPLKNVRQSLDEVKRMTEAAESVYTSLKLLLELKQQQNNTIELRIAREEAEVSQKLEESSQKLAKAATTQGKRIMVFTVVTIIFLPMSYISTFFAMDIRQFHDPQDGLNIKLVLSIMFPVSAAIVIPLLLLAFNVEKAEDWWNSFVNRVHGKKNDKDSNLP